MVAGASMAMMALIFSGLTSISRLLMMNPSSFPEGTVGVYRQACSGIPLAVGCDTSGVSTFKYNQCTLVKVKRKIWEIDSKRKGQIKDKLYKRN